MTAPSRRTRRSGSLGPSTTVYRWGNDVLDPNPPWTFVTKASRKGTMKTMTDIVTPNFAQWIARRGIVNNPMWLTLRECYGGDSGWAFEAPVPGNRYFGECTGDWCLTIYGPPAPSNLHDDTVEALAAQSATAAWAGVNVGEFQGLANLAQLNQTLNLLGDPIRTISGFLRQKAWADAAWKAARGKLAKQRALAQLLSSLWLQYQYAFRPVLIDIENIMSELQDQTFSLRRTSRDNKSSTITTTRSYTGTSWDISVDFTEKQVTTISVRSGILYQGTVDPLKQFGLHWTNLPSAAWEITPWSFVVDWFLNVGDYLQAIMPKVGVDILATWQTRDVTHVVERTCGSTSITSGSPWVTKRHLSGVDTAVFRDKVRTNVLQAPSITITPSLKTAMLTGNRGINAYMLFLQSFLGSTKAR